MKDGRGFVPNALFRTSRMKVGRRVLPPDDELAPGRALVGAYLDDVLIARSLCDEDFDPEEDAEFFQEPVEIVYLGFVDPDGTIKAFLNAERPVPPEAWRGGDHGEEEWDGVFLGIVDRLPGDVVCGSHIFVEAGHHFASILAGKAVPRIDRILAHL